uniref:Cytochrome c oxidase subunit 3 n=1 Tax=Crella elegans TaxID=252961 RepID=A0A0H4KPD8_CREEL|nr:cytochrome c oxidase subunit III [Crella elegans]AKO90219.1 cytochrome c oxidase subunit 3 [Crella elegans]
MAEQAYHPYHLVDPSPWPLVGACGAFFTTVGGVLYFHYSQSGLLVLGLVLIIGTMIVWWRDVIREGTYQGCHTFIVRQGLKYGMILFIVSEVCLFFSFFWAFFHSSLAPTIDMGGVWPPVGVNPLDPFSIPLLNTAILLSSGATVTWAHHGVIGGNRTEAIRSLALTVILGVIFTGLQGMEYYEAPFTISDSVYGSSFFVTTGAHGGHVLIGSMFLLVCLYRLVNFQFTRHHHLGFEAAAWYWHFVDVVWLFLFVFMYWWGS